MFFLWNIFVMLGLHIDLAVCDSHGILKNIISFELLLQVINIPSNIRDKELYVYFILDALCDFSLFSVFICIGIVAVHEY